MKLKNYKEIEVSKFDQLPTKLSCLPFIDFQKFDLLLYGSGGQDRKFYGVEGIWKQFNTT